jgi:hypothetical protein
VGSRTRGGDQLDRGTGSFGASDWWKHTRDGRPTAVARGRTRTKAETAPQVCSPFWGTTHHGSRLMDVQPDCPVPWSRLQDLLEHLDRRSVLLFGCAAASAFISGMDKSTAMDKRPQALATNLSGKRSVRRNLCLTERTPIQGRPPIVPSVRLQVRGPSQGSRAAQKRRAMKIRFYGGER